MSVSVFDPRQHVEQVVGKDRLVMGGDLGAGEPAPVAHHPPLELGMAFGRDRPGFGADQEIALVGGDRDAFEIVELGQAPADFRAASRSSPVSSSSSRRAPAAKVSPGSSAPPGVAQKGGRPGAAKRNSRMRPSPSSSRMRAEGRSTRGRSRRVELRIMAEDAVLVEREAAVAAQIVGKLGQRAHPVAERERCRGMSAASVAIRFGKA